MAFQEISSTGWFGRIGNSLKGILFGLLLAVVSVVVLIWNERNAVADIKANKEIAAVVVSIGNETVDPANEGKLVHLNGPGKTEDVLKNKKFGIEESAIRLTWNAQIYQWVEDKRTETKKKLGGGEETVTTYEYKQEWVSAPVNSSKFKEAGHDNTGEQVYKSGSTEAKNVSLGAFNLAPGLISQISSSEPYALKRLPADLNSSGQLSNGKFYTGNMSSPNIGDEKVEFTITRPGDVSVMAVQSKDTFKLYKTKSGKEKFLLYEGLLSAQEVVQGEESKAKFLRWALRGGGALVMFLGFCMILKPLSVLADVIPFLGSLVGGATAVVSFLLALGISFVIMAISWITFRPMIGIPLLVLGVGCLVMIIMKISKAKKQASLVPPPPNLG